MSDSDNLEMRVVSRIVDTQDVTPLLKCRVTPRHFKNPLARQLYEEIQEYMSGAGHLNEVPSRDTLLRRFPAFEEEYVDTDEHLRDLVQDLLESYKKRRLADVIDVAASLADKDIKRTVAYMQDELRKLGALGEMARDVDVAESYQDAIDAYYKAKETQGLLGFPYPWPTLTEATAGMARQNMIVFYGRPKSMKTWLLIEIAVYAYLFCNARVLFFSYEMSVEEIRRRVTAVIARVHYESLRKAKLPPDQEESYEAILATLIDVERLQEEDGVRRRCFRIIQDPAGTLDTVRAKIQETDPDLVFADTFHKMTDTIRKTATTEWQNVSNLSNGWKRIAQNADIPVILSTHANRSGEKTRGEAQDEVSFSDGPMMDCDLMVRVIKEKQATERGAAVLTLKFPGMREGNLDTMTLYAMPALYLSEAPPDQANHPPVPTPVARVNAYAAEDGTDEDSPRTRRGAIAGAELLKQQMKHERASPRNSRQRRP